MILTSSPLRVSFVGGGTDMVDWFYTNGGAVVSCAIDQYVYAMFGNLSPIWGSNYKFTYSKLEEVKHFDEIKHPVIRESFRQWAPRSKKISLVYSSDMPGNSGLGSSSAFCNAVNYGLSILNKEKKLTKYELAKRSIYIERDVLKEAGGWQDQIATSYGGFNAIRFDNTGFTVIPLPHSFIEEYLNNCVLIYVGNLRKSHKISQTQISCINTKVETYKEMMRITEKAISAVHSGDLSLFSAMIDESWKLKADYSENITNSQVNSMVNKVRDLGGTGIKLLGAGAGGFLIARFAEAQNIDNIGTELSTFTTGIKPVFNGTQLNCTS